jgi:hypothetical protein
MELASKFYNKSFFTFSYQCILLIFLSFCRDDIISFYSIATHEADIIFSSFANFIVLATFYAVEEEIDRDNYIKMPMIGNNWFLRDAI